MKRTFPVLLGLLLAASPSICRAQFSTSNANGSIIITGYSGTGGAVAIPSVTNGLPVVAIASNAFGVSSNITSLTIPGSVTNIGNYAFYSAVVLSNVVLSNGVTSIGAGAFGYCTNLAAMSIPASVTNIGTTAFADCTNLVPLTVDPANSFYTASNGVLFNNSLTTLVEYPAASNGSYTIPNTVTNIASYAFFDCAGLSAVTIPTNVNTIGNDAFSGCLNLTNFSMASGVRSLGIAAFCFETSLSNIAIPSTVTNLGGLAFWGGSAPGGLYFSGNAPVSGAGPVYPTNGLFAYYLPGASGWSGFSNVTGIGAVLWNPVLKSARAQGGQFMFDATNAASPIAILKTATDLVHPDWTTLGTITLTNGVFHFTNLLNAGEPDRFYTLAFP